MPRSHHAFFLGHLGKLFHLPDGGTVTDRELLQAFSAHRDESAFAALVQRHGLMVLGVCRRVLGNEHDIEDAFQAAFLVLAHKAGSTRWHDSVASWLYEVAWRLATKVRTANFRRQRFGKAVEIMSADPTWLAADRELQSMIDEELRRLPEKYRLPLILCCLEGAKRSQAAQQLGWKEGTVAGRLARARQLLQKRLSKRGVALSVGLFSTASAEHGATAGVPAALINVTVKAAFFSRQARR
jgi:RNA polymerase sigma factor (sigma-70 family)